MLKPAFQKFVSRKKRLTNRLRNLSERYPKRFFAGLVLLYFLFSVVLSTIIQIIPPKRYFDNPDFPYAEKVSEGVSILKNQDPIKQTLASAPKENLNLKETKNSFKWQVKLTSGTTFNFGKVTKEGILPVVRVQNTQGYYVQHSPKGFKGTVNPKVKGNIISWEVTKGVTAKYTMQKDRVKEDIVVASKDALAINKVFFDIVSGSKDVKDPLSGELMPEGDIDWFSGDENVATTHFSFPKPTTIDSSRNGISSEYQLSKVKVGQYLLTIYLNSKDLSAAKFPITIDPVTVDASSVAGGTAYGNGRKILRDSFGNLITVIGDTNIQSDSVFFKALNSSSWTDAGIQLSNGISNGGDLNPAADIDSSGNIHVSFIRQDTLPSITGMYYVKLTVTRNTSNAITGISAGTRIILDSSALTNRPSLIIANKGGGSGVEKVAVAYAVNTTGATPRGEVRFMQCDVSDTCTTAANWKNASEEKNASSTCNDSDTVANNGLPSNAANAACKGVADALFAYTVANTKHHVVLQQMPGRPKRSPARAVKNINGSLTDLTNAINNTPATTVNFTGYNSVNSYVYVGDSEPFSKLTTDITSPNGGNDGEFAVGYCSANSDPSTSCDTWTSVSISSLVDLTSSGVSGGLSWAADGSILFDQPAGWVKSTENGGSQAYFIRLDDNGSGQVNGVTVDEFYVSDRNSRALVVIGGVDSTDDLRAAYVVWDDITNNSWENKQNSVGIPWVQDAGGASSALADDGGNWTTFTNFPLSATVDYINNVIYVGFRITSSSGLIVKAIKVNESLTSAWRLTYADSHNIADAMDNDAAISLVSSENLIYAFYEKGGSIIYTSCNPGTEGTGNICDVDANNLLDDWGYQTGTFSTAATFQHPQAVLSKMPGDTTAIDVIYTNTTGPSVQYERQYVNNADKTITVVDSSDNATSWDCSSAIDFQQQLLNLGRDDTNCAAGTGDGLANVGLRFPNITVPQGTVISSAYIDFNVITRFVGTGSIDFTIYGEDVDSSATYPNINTLPGCDSTCVHNRTRTTSSYAKSVDFKTNSYRIDVTNIIQEQVCRGAGSSQPCVGNFNGSGSWSSGNALSILLISSEETFNNEIAINDASTVHKPTLQINVAEPAANPTNITKIDDAGDPGTMSPGGRNIVRASNGSLYSFINDGGSCEIWKSTNGGTWTEQDSSDNPTCKVSPGVSIAIGSTGIIQLAYVDETDGTLGKYITFDTSNDQFGSEETYIDATGEIDGDSIVVDSNNKPHIVYSHSAGTSDSSYINKVGASWSTPIEHTQIGDGFYFDNSMDEDNLPENLTFDYEGPVTDMYAVIGNQNNPTSLSEQIIDSTVSNDTSGSIAVDSSGNTWVAYVDENGATDFISLRKHNDNDSWATWQSPVTNSNAGSDPSIAINGTDIYVFYKDENSDIAYDMYNGSTWKGEKTLHQGTYQRPKAKWSYYNNNQGSSQIDYLYSDGTDIYWNSLDLNNKGKIYSMGVQYPHTGSTDLTNLDHPLSSDEYGAMEYDDSGYASVSAELNPTASTSAVPMFMFKVNNPNNNNSYKIDATAKVMSTIPTNSGTGGSKPMHMQIYRGGSTNNWVDVATDTGTAGDTEMPLDMAEITTNTSEYYHSPGNSVTATSVTNPGTVVNDNAGGDTAWSNLSSAISSDNTYATVAFSGSAYSQYLKATNFGFSIPSTAVVTGIKVDIERKSSLSNEHSDSVVKLVSGGTISGENKAYIGSYYPTSDAYASYGGSTDLWQLGLTAADVNSSNFGVALLATSEFFQHTVSVDHIRMTVYYTTDDMWTYWRVWQEASGLSGTNQILSADYFNVTYAPNGPDSVLISNTPSAFTAGGCSATAYQIQLQSGGVGTNPTGSTTIQITTNSGGTFSIWANSGCGSGQYSSGDITFSTSENTKTFYVKDTKKGTNTVTATQTAGSDTIASDTDNYTVNAAAVDRLVVTLPGQSFTDGVGNSGSPTNRTAGASFNITQISATDQYYNVNATSTNYDSDTRTLAYSGPSNAPDTTPPTYTTSVQFTNGISTTTLATTLYKAESTPITVTDTGALGLASTSVTVARGSITPTIASSVTAASTGNINSDITVTMTFKDSWGNLNTTIQGSDISFTGTTGTYVITSSPTNANGSGISTADLRWSNTGTKTVQVSITGHGDLLDTHVIDIGTPTPNTAVRGGTKIRGGVRLQ